MSLNLYRQYAMRSPGNSKTRKEWLRMAAAEECRQAISAGRPFSPIEHKPRIVEARKLGRDWYAVY